ncbi:MAG TPA: recombinase family protein [Armatimonadota bacterium]|jgi:DNA invertase Pin-like site-specific DNA recombinase
MKIGYARVSSEDQNLDLQQDALTQAGCERIYGEKESGGKADRPELLRLLEMLRPGDTLVVWRLDRLGRSLKHLIETVERLEATGVGFQSVTEAIDTTTSGGKLVFHIFAALAEFERTLIRERTRAGPKAARARGRQGGRPTVLSPDKRRMAQALRDDHGQNVTAICKTLGIARTTFYRHTEGKKTEG